MIMELVRGMKDGERVRTLDPHDCELEEALVAEVACGRA